MNIPLIAAFIAGLTTSQIAWAQNEPNANQPSPDLQPPPTSSQPQTQNNPRSQGATQNQSVPEVLLQQLRSYGFSDVKVKPDSYIVTGKKDGQTLVLWLTPDTATVLAEETSDEDSTVGRGANSPNPNDPTSAEQNLK